MSKSKKLPILPFVDIFDAALAKDDSREIKERSYMYASEICMSKYDRYLSMKGVPPSNPPNEIALRKFKIGNLIEDFFKLVLYEMGLLHSYEKRVYSDFDWGLKVSGRLDVVYGGKFNINDISDVLEKFKFLTFIGVLSKAIREFAKLNPNVEYSLVGLEIKSCSDKVFDRIEATGKPQRHHEIQAFHYAYWEQMPFLLVYFDKNNGRIKQFWVLPDNKELYSEYTQDILEMSQYYLTDTPPPKENKFLFTDKFSSNWAIQYSKYLTSEYGYKSKQDFVDATKPIADRWNRVLKRMAEGKELTPDNIAAIKEMNAAGFEVALPEVVDIPHEVVNETPRTQEQTETAQEKLNKLQTLLGGGKK